MMAMLPFCLILNLLSLGDADPRHAFYFSAVLLSHTASKVLPLIRFNCPAICSVVGRLALKSLN